jgi:hypothetical protein
LNLNFDLADKFFKTYLHKTAGIITKDQKRRNEKAKGSKPFDKGRDPVLAKDSMDGLISSFSWSDHLDKAELFTNWENVVGKDSAEASRTEDFQAFGKRHFEAHKRRFPEPRRHRNQIFRTQCTVLEKRLQICPR